MIMTKVGKQINEAYYNCFIYIAYIDPINLNQGAIVLITFFVVMVVAESNNLTNHFDSSVKNIQYQHEHYGPSAGSLILFENTLIYRFQISFGWHTVAKIPSLQSKLWQDFKNLEENNEPQLLHNRRKRVCI